MKIYVDIDGTICETPYIKDKWDYRKSVPTQSHIDKINKLYNEGNEIIYWTARGSNSGIDWYEFTLGQLSSWGCKFHKLICGKEKGAFDMVIDDKAKRIEEI
jgi:hypothetical protein